MNITNFEYSGYSESTSVLELHKKATFIAVISSRKLTQRKESHGYSTATDFGSQNGAIGLVLPKSFGVRPARKQNKS